MKKVKFLDIFLGLLISVGVVMICMQVHTMIDDHKDRVAAKKIFDEIKLDVEDLRTYVSSETFKKKYCLDRRTLLRILISSLAESKGFNHLNPSERRREIELLRMNKENPFAKVLLEEHEKAERDEIVASIPYVLARKSLTYYKQDLMKETRDYIAKHL